MIDDLFFADADVMNTFDIFLIISVIFFVLLTFLALEPLMQIFTECNNLNNNFARTQPITVLLFKFFLIVNKESHFKVLSLCDCNAKCRLLSVRYLHVILFRRIY